MAAPTGLIQIPTAQVLGSRQVTLSLQNGNTQLKDQPNLFHQPQLLYETQGGLGAGLEGGIDVAPSKPPGEYRPEANLKWRFLDEDYTWPSAAVGAEQLGVGFPPAGYVVFTRTLDYAAIENQKFRAHHRNIKLRGYRLHAGMLYDGYGFRALLGADFEITDHLVLASDWISGDRYSASFGGFLVLDQNNSLAVAGLHGNRGQAVDGMFLQYNLNFGW